MAAYLDPDAEASLAQRMGAALYRQRRAVENNPRRRPQDMGNWREALSWRLKPHRAAGLLLKASFLWRRGYRNYLNLRVVEVPVRLPRLPPAFDGYKILQLTDLHLNLAPELVPVIRKRLSGVGYDLAVITGDFKNLPRSDTGEVVSLTKELLPSIRPPYYATLGNHDTIDLVPPLEAAGLRFLLNESLTLEKGGAAITLAGVDDSYLFDCDDIPRALHEVPPERFKLLLSHAPTNYREAEAAGVDYFLSGHTHGGQICLGSGQPLIPSGRVPSELVAGRWKYGRMHGYTSRGTGGCHLPVRFNCPGEITVHVLKTGGTREDPQP